MGEGDARTAPADNLLHREARGHTGRAAARALTRLRANSVPSQRVTGMDDLREALRTAIEDSGPRLVEVDVAPGMSLF